MEELRVGGEYLLYKRVICKNSELRRDRALGQSSLPTFSPMGTVLGSGRPVEVSLVES